MQTWVIVYQIHTGELFGWFCKAATASVAEEKFWETVNLPSRRIKCIGDFQSNVADALLSLYREETHE